MNYRLTITLNSDICIGNGESKGNSIDSDICVDEMGIPYIPARRIKGCLRDTAEFLFSNGYKIDNKKLRESDVTELFGDPFGNKGSIIITDAQMWNSSSIAASIRKLKKENKEYLNDILHPEKIERCFTAIRGQTKMEDGLKVDGTLRFTRVLTKNNYIFNKDIPVKFISNIEIDENVNLVKLLEASCKGTRHIGTNRNRGLGNVTMMLEKVSDNNKPVLEIASNGNVVPGKKYELEYKISLDSMVSIPGFGESITLIPGSSVIGCFGGYFINKNPQEMKVFEDLFLNGKVKWSALTPVVSGKISKPVPMLLLELKNADGKIINQYGENKLEWKRFKPKTLDGKYAIKNDDGFEIVSVHTHAQYHNSISKEMLYMQDAIDAGCIYGGTVTFDGKYYDDIVDIISNANLRFGRSRNVQYSNCHIIPHINVKPFEEKNKNIKGHIYIVANSDLIIREKGVNITDGDDIREYIATKLDLNDYEKSEDTDCIKYGLNGGFNNMWHLQKMHTSTVKAGSVFCFNISETELPECTYIGDMLQEGFGSISIYSKDEIERLVNNKKGKIDIEDTDADIMLCKNIENALIAMVVKECMIRYSRNNTYYDYKIPISRLRLMLQRSTDYKDFRNKITSIKTNDMSSESNGRKDAAIKFVDSFIGNNDSINWEKLLNDEPGLFDKIKSDNELMHEIEKMWKLPLMEKLHVMHYGKGKNKA